MSGYDNTTDRPTGEYGSGNTYETTGSGVTGSGGLSSNTTGLDRSGGDQYASTGTTGSSMPGDSIRGEARETYDMASGPGDSARFPGSSGISSGGVGRDEYSSNTSGLDRSEMGRDGYSSNTSGLARSGGEQCASTGTTGSSMPGDSIRGEARETYDMASGPGDSSRFPGSSGISGGRNEFGSSGVGSTGREYESSGLGTDNPSHRDTTDPMSSEYGSSTTSGAGYGNKSSSVGDVGTSDTRFGSSSNTGAYSGGDDKYGSGATGGPGFGNKSENTPTTEGKHGDSTMGKLMEKAGNMLKNENMAEKGHHKREEKGAFDSSETGGSSGNY